VDNNFCTSLAAAVYYESCCVVPAQNNNDAAADADDDRLIVINAMNEWAEGMALEPSDLYGHQFLEAIQEVKFQQAEHGCKKVRP
jgi:Glycosyltransferase WbsX